MERYIILYNFNFCYYNLWNYRKIHHLGFMFTFISVYNISFDRYYLRYNIIEKEKKC